MQSMDFVMEAESWSLTDFKGTPGLLLDGFMVNNQGDVPVAVIFPSRSIPELQTIAAALDDFHTLACQWYVTVPNPLVKVRNAELLPYYEGIQFAATSCTVLSKIEDH